jgi:hypothetical protein
MLPSPSISACFQVGLIVISSTVISFALRGCHDTIFVDCQSNCQVQTRVLARAELLGLRLIDYKAHSACCILVFSAFFFNDSKSTRPTHRLPHFHKNCFGHPHQQTQIIISHFSLNHLPKMSAPEVSHGRGGAGNINPDNTKYVDGEVVRVGAEGSQGDGAFSTGRGGTCELPSRGIPSCGKTETPNPIPNLTSTHPNHKLERRVQHSVITPPAAHHTPTLPMPSLGWR